MAAVVEIGLHGRLRLRVVGGCGAGHGGRRHLDTRKRVARRSANNTLHSAQYKWIARAALRAGRAQPRPTNGILLAMIVMN